MPRETDQKESPKAAPQGSARRKFRFEAAGGLVQAQIRKAGESRGFASARILTHWAEIAGPELARLCRPQRISYAQRGFGATLVLEVPGAAAPLVQMRLEALKARINSAFGYAAVARVQIVHVHGFTPMAEAAKPATIPAMAEPAAPFIGAPAALRSDNLALPDRSALSAARGVVGQLTEGVADAGLKEALARLALNVLHRSQMPGEIARPAAAPIHRKDDQ